MALLRTTFVIPCFNEELRLDVNQVERLTELDSVSVLLVDDGSKDRTASILRMLAERLPRVTALELPSNHGKGEAVRRGLLRAMEQEAEVVGYLDADFATSAQDALEMVQEMERSKVQALLGARVRLLGRQIERRALRHYLGRVFASFASWSLGLSVYDTQCGAKLFRNGSALREALEQPFSSRWVFDVELIHRLLTATQPLAVVDFREHPLSAWQDRAGSKLTFTAMFGAAIDLFAIHRGRVRALRERRQGKEVRQGKVDPEVAEGRRLDDE